MDVVDGHTYKHSQQMDAGKPTVRLNIHLLKFCPSVLSLLRPPMHQRPIYKELALPEYLHHLVPAFELVQDLRPLR